MAARTPQRKKSPAKVAVIGLLAVAVTWFAVQGGEYGTTDLVRQQRRTQLLQREVDSLRHQVDSLVRYKQAVETDPVTQERLAREQFGMVKGDKEILYRFAEPPAPAADRR